MIGTSDQSWWLAEALVNLRMRTGGSLDIRCDET